MTGTRPMSTLRENSEKRVFRIGILVIALGSVAIFPFFGLRAGGSFLAGGALSAVSLLWLRHSVGSLTLANAKHSKQRALAGFLLRLLLIPLCLYVMIRVLHISVPAAVAGFAAFHCSIFIEGILEAFEGSRK